MEHWQSEVNGFEILWNLNWGLEGERSNQNRFVATVTGYSVPITLGAGESREEGKSMEKIEEEEIP